MSNEVPFTAGTGDVFKDFGFSDEESIALTLKASLFRTLQKALRETTETQIELAQRLGVTRQKISDILNGKMAGISVERVANCLLKLNYEICVDAHPAPEGSSGRIIDLSILLAVK